MLDAIRRTAATTAKRLAKLLLEKADIAIEPFFYKGNWWNFSLANFYKFTGYKYCEKEISR